MNILVINSGSSSIKFQGIEMPSEKVICKGIVEQIGSANARLSYNTNHINIQETGGLETHKDSLQRVVSLLLDPEKGVIKQISDIHMVGHRVVHGGNSFSKTTIINAEVKEKIKQYASLAPLHNPHNLQGILLAEHLFPSVKQVAVFDTAFHQTIPLVAQKYAIPNMFFTEHQIQVYGFHGTSHKYVSERAIDYLKLEKSKIISIHLGNGCSMTAIVDGKSIDHSLGFTPSTGLIMGSRSGDIDHSIIFYMVNNLGYSVNDVENLLNKESGMLGLTGYNDLRDIQAGVEKGNTNCILAMEINAYRIKKYIGSYASIMNGLDAIIFTAGIGENSSMLRKMVCSNLDYLGIAIDHSKNEEVAKEIREINTSLSKVKILVIPTNEELEIAKQAYELLE
ncbi:acetate kinase [uncultured Dokdonia sp.]|uniref:acetate/propionate family kinase n=1 Tax=uncultured Dokdonia sp. TaxID=575653 RepID=UPI0026317730|nr:acetate kinase [uncultured Dokdonia sp.]